MNTIRRISPRRRLLATVLGLSLLGTGIFSFAVVTDNLDVTNEYAMLNVTLEASSDGTTYTADLSQQWTLERGVRSNQAVHLRNAGNGQASIGFAGSGTGDSELLNADYDIYEVASIGDCPDSNTIPTGTVLTPVSSTLASTTIGSGLEFILDPAEEIILCQSVNGIPPAVTPSATVTQVVTFTATSTL